MTKKGRKDMFLDFAAMGGGTIFGIAMVELLTGLIGLVIGYFIVQYARSMKETNPESSLAGLLELVGIFIMFGPFATFLFFTNME
jgi:hypothetical protein